jgi:hypothetical protein
MVTIEVTSLGQRPLRHSGLVRLEPSHMQRHFWREVWRFRELFLILAWRDLTVRYKQTILGSGWAVLKPLLKLGAVIWLELLAETAPENRRSWNCCEPSEGCVEIEGQVASLLEVGTGFHPELTRRENVFLNGAILGTSKNEVRKKFDEIVAPAGIEKFLDTPVKRYSSGLYVRLAFSVKLDWTIKQLTWRAEGRTTPPFQSKVQGMCLEKFGVALFYEHSSQLYRRKR